MSGTIHAYLHHCLTACPIGNPTENKVYLYCTPCPQPTLLYSREPVPEYGISGLHTARTVAYSGTSGNFSTVGGSIMKLEIRRKWKEKGVFAHGASGQQLVKVITINKIMAILCQSYPIMLASPPYYLRFACYPSSHLLFSCPQPWFPRSLL